MDEISNHVTKKEVSFSSTVLKESSGKKSNCFGNNIMICPHAYSNENIAMRQNVYVASTRKHRIQNLNPVDSEIIALSWYFDGIATVQKNLVNIGNSKGLLKRNCVGETGNI